MSAALPQTEPAMPTAPAPPAEPGNGCRPFRWTLEAYEALVENGILDGERVELLGGAIVTMSPRRSAHATAVSLAEEVLRTFAGPGRYVRVQLPLNLRGDSQPEPDLALVKGVARDYKDAHPAMADLVVEVADTSLATDQSVKASLYASAGIAEYWIINLQDNLLEVHRQ